MFTCDNCHEEIKESESGLCDFCNDAQLEEERIDKRERDKWQG